MTPRRDRARPARARRRRPSPSPTLRSRVSTLPRRSSTVTPGERPEQLRPPPDAGRPDHGSGRERRFAQRPGRPPDPRGEERRRSPTPSSSSAGRSLAEWTATSISSRSSASRIVSTNSPFSPAGASRDGAPSSPDVDIGTISASVAVLREPAPDLLRLREGERRAARADPERHSSSGSRRRSSISSFACRSSAPGSERSFSSTIGSCRSFAATPRASASTASRSSGVRSHSRLA